MLHDYRKEWTDNAEGQVAAMTARNPNTGSQVTRYVYGSTTSESAVARSDLLRAVIYPDSVVVVPYTYLVTWLPVLGFRAVMVAT